MSARCVRTLRTAALLAGVLAGAALGGCSSAATTPTHPDLSQSGSEAPVAVTVPSGPETLPTWQRRDGRATLAIPAELLFARDSADLGPAAAGALGLVVAEVGARPGSPARVLVEGHADGDGDPGYNQELSERRAAAVGDWLSAHGVDPGLISTRGWGETRPAVGETDEATKAENRRVVVTVTFPTAASASASASPPQTVARRQAGSSR